MPRLSIIITFFNETAFIKMAVSSVLSQSIDDLEIIIVNDNPQVYGPDYFNTLNLADSITVLHHPENKGLSAARNTGIAAAKAPLIGFLDADDYYTTGGLGLQLALAEQSGADITHAGCYLTRAGSPELEVLRRDKLLFHTAKTGAGLAHLEEAQFITSSWASLYRRDFLNASDLRFDEEQPKFEDRLFVLHTVTAARKIATLGAPARVWRQRGGSISVTPTDAYIHRLQVQLLEKCMAHMSQEVASGRLSFRFEKRELFNTVGRLIWDMDIIDPIVSGKDPAYAEFGQRIVALLNDARFGAAIFDDTVLSPISRVGMKTRKGFITRTMFFHLHKALREGDFAEVQALLTKAKAGPAKKAAKSPPTLDVDVILHLGMHKTGSTFIQHHLTHHRNALLEAGIFVPGPHYQNVQSETIREGASSGHAKLILGVRSAEKSTIWQELRRDVVQSGAKTVVISCENMLFPINADRDVLLGNLMDHLSMFRSARVMAFVRRPDSFLESFYKEIVANGQRMGSRSLQEFMVDHAATLTNLPALFAPIEARINGTVILRDFDLAARSGKVWETFCEACDLPEGLAAQAVPRYPSAGRNGTEAARLVNTLIAEKRQRQRMLRDLFQALPPEPDKMTILSPTERNMLIDRFAEASAAFSEARGYAPDYAKMRKSIPKKWAPLEGMNGATVTAIMQSRLRAELPHKLSAQHSIHDEASPPQNQSKQFVFRVKPRPWVVSALKWRPFR